MHLFLFKIALTITIIWGVVHLSAYPTGLFAEWGEKKFGSYFRFIDVLTAIFLIPIFGFLMSGVLVILFS